MILATTIQAEKGKELVKTANERIHITLTRNKIPIYFIYFDINKIVVEAIPEEKEVLRIEK